MNVAGIDAHAAASSWREWLLLGSLVVTSALVGLIWVVQVVLYPLFTRVPATAFAAYHEAHARRITFVVAPLMSAELVLALALIAAPPAGVAAAVVWLAAGLVALTWLSTALVQVPLHGRAARGDAAALRALVTTNWLRTAAWTLRAVLLAWMALGAGA